jgi:HEAT repeat protein
MLGELGSVNPAWVKDEQPFIMEKLVESKVWNERRYAALAMGSIGSSEPSFAKDAIPIMIGYVAHPKEVARELGNLAKADPKVSIDLGVAASMGADPAVWLQDACIDAFGIIGEKSPESVDGAIALLESIAKEDNSPYTRTKAAHALDLIRRKR